MTLEDLKAAKATAQQKICNAILDFNAETGQDIKEIIINTGDLGDGQSQILHVDVVIELKL